MRRIVVLSALVLGCTSNSLPIESGSSTGGTNGGSTAGTTSAGTNGGGTTAGTNGGGTTAGTNGGNGGTTGGGPGTMCNTACDCKTGLACFQGQCVQSPMGQFYCCDDTQNCPSGQLCQSSDTSLGSCGSGPSAGQCKTACDCKGGEACFNGACTMVPQGQLYCCETNCPSSGGFCQSQDGSFMMCGGGGGTIGGNGGNGGMNGGNNGGNGGTDMCRNISCKTNSDCTSMGCGRCSMRTNTCRIM